MKTPWSSTPWRRVIVYGLGLSGTAAAELLRREGVEVVGVDSRAANDLELGGLATDEGFRLLDGGEDGALPESVDGVVLSPGVPPDRPLVVAARQRGIPVVAEVELAFTRLEGTVVGVTGSNGKSTTTAMTGAILRAAGQPVEVCGNIGRPLSACVEGAPGRVFVVELSSFQLEGIQTLRPRVAVLLNLSPDHLDRHGDLEGYGRAKARIFRFQGPEDTAVVNEDDPLVASLDLTARRRSFSMRGPVEDGCYLDGDVVVEVDGPIRRRLFERSDLRVPGPQNVENAMAAALLALAVGIGPAAIGPGLRTFRGLPHRLAFVRELGGVRWYDDSKGTNPGATGQALAGFDDGRVHLVLGGRSKDADFGPLVERVVSKARRVYLVGEAADELERLLTGRVRLTRSGSLEEAVAKAATHAAAGEVVVLSPACSSFDQFENFAARGRHFQRLVEALPEAG